MKLIQRRYQNGTDYERIREFLRCVFMLNDRREGSWPLYRWDYWRWHVNENIHRFQLEAAVLLWESRCGQIGAALNPDSPGEAFLQVHPAFASPELEVELISAAEALFPTAQPDGRQKLLVWCPENNVLRQHILKRRGYTPLDWSEYQRFMPLDNLSPASPLPPGYTIRPLAGEDELPARSWLSWKAFHENEPDERYGGWEWYRNVQRAPLYRRDLDLVAVAPTGELAAFATLWFDPHTHTAAFEPVGTHPAFRRLGLGRALLQEGLRCTAALGATQAAVSSYSESAGALYASVGFTSYDVNQPWEKCW
jgi:mycothiol synthase